MSQPYRLGKLTRRRTDGSKYTDIVIKWSDADGPHRVSLGTADKVAAEAAARRFWDQRTLAKCDTIGDIVTAYLDSLNGSKDEARKRARWRMMRPFWGSLTVADIDLETSRTAYPEWRKRANNSLRNELGLIRSALHWARDEKKIITVAPKIVLPTMPLSKVSHLTKAQFRTFLAGCVMPHVKLFAMLAVSTGARKTALLEAKWEQVSWNGCLLDLQGSREVVGNKGRAIVPLGELIMNELRAAKDGAITEYIIEYGGEKIADIRNGIKAAAKRSGVRCHPHMFRHSAAVWMAEDRVPMSEIAAFLGHKDSRITERVYAKYHPDFLRQAAKSLSW